ncbi:MAG: NAD-dependent succinate-semialdehyde dehydrogenase [Chloroflexi bacterium]|nr:NAD-dependent succinate-semialdehyde dehydrogenase [Chloroflexota bacterium]
MGKEYQLLINGLWKESESGETFDVVNPANMDVVARCAKAGQEETVQALEAAQKAFETWRFTPARERSNLMHKAAAIFRQRIDTIARLLTLEHGKPLQDSFKELAFSADVIDYYAEEARRLLGSHFEGDAGPTHSFVFQQPLGVVAAITPWNFPVDLLSWKVGPGLAVGCTFVVKPPSQAPLAAIEFLRCFEDACFPPGVINIVTGSGSVVGAEMVTHPISRKIAFTGSTQTGLWIAEQAAKQLKHVSLELGGSAPFVVCKDADLDLAVPQALRRSFSHTGQICISVNRIFVHEDLADEFIRRFAESASKLRVANGLKEPDADMGPMIDQNGLNTVLDHLQDAIANGAEVVTGGKPPAGEEYEHGYFFLPTVLTKVTRDMKVMREETFGPIAPISTFRTIDEAVEMANDTPYGLAAYVFTNDLDTAMYMAERIEAGGIGVNVNDITDIRGPFGGMKMSGVGRELGKVGLDSYLETKHVRVLRRKPRE